MDVGITGHQEIGYQSRWKGVRARIEKVLSQAQRPLTGLTSLAVGADQEFAEAILDQGGKLVAIIPFEGYERTFAEGSDRERYLRLLGRARVEVLSEVDSGVESYYEAGKRIVDLCDLLVAVWDGNAPDGRGGTRDVVAYAQEQGKPIVRIDPADL
jgi:hypothetical protein